MKPFVLTLCLAGSGFLAACAQQPTAPSALNFSATAGSRGTQAKPGSGEPGTAIHDLMFEPSIFGDPGSDGYASPGHIQAVSPAGGLQGWIAGPTASGNFKASATGSYTMLITDVSDVPGEPGDPCTEAQQTTLRDAGVLASPVTGSLTLTLGEDTTGGSIRPYAKWELANINSAGSSWKILGHSGLVNPLFFPQFDSSSSTTSLIVTVENSALDFQRYSAGGCKPELVAGKCRADFTLRLTKR